MRRSLVGFVLFGSVLVAGCGEQSRRPLAPKPLGEVSSAAAAACPSPDSIVTEIDSLFSGGNQTAVLSQFANIQALMGPTPPGFQPDTAQAHALSLIGYVLNKYQQGTLNGGQSAATQREVVALVNSFLCFTGLPSSFQLGDLGPDGAFALIFPTTGDTTVVTGTKFAGVHLDTASVSVPTLLTITRLPDAPGPLLTQLDQYPLFYEFHVSPESSFVKPVVVGVCQAISVPAPDPTRLRVAHNVAPFTPGSIQILPIQPAPFLDCTLADVQVAASANPLFQFARAGWRTLRPVLASLFLPDRLMAFATSGVGGTTRNFSPFGAVDTLVVMSANSPLAQHFPVGGTVPNPPSVLLATPAGHRFSGLAVNFAVTAGGGSLTGASTTTDTSGIATVGSWTLGLTPGLNTVAATATPPHAGSGVLNSPLTFSATATPPSKLAFTTQPSGIVAGATMAPAVQVAVQDAYGDVVTSSSAPITLAVSQAGVPLLGTATAAATQGIASFGTLTVTKAGTGWTLLATSSGLTSATSAPFAVTNAAAATILKVAGDNQTAPAGTTLATDPAVRVVDQYGNPVAGVPVTFTPQNGGSVTGASQTTDATGTATVGSWSIVEGTNYLLATANAPGIAVNPVTFTATGTTSTSSLVNCPVNVGSRDDLTRAFYWPKFGGTSLRQVDLYLSSNASANAPTPYTVQLIATAGGYNGPVIGTSTVTVFLRGTPSENLQTHFVFNGTPAVQKNSTVAFRFNVTSGNAPDLRFNVGPCGLGVTQCKSGCPLVETNDATGTLSTFRRVGCGAAIYGSY